MKSKLDCLFREIREVVALISKEGIGLSRGWDYTRATEFREGERPEEYTPSTVIIHGRTPLGGWARWRLEVPKYVRDRLIAMTLKIDTIRTHGMLHSPIRGTRAEIWVNGELVDRIYLVQPHPHGDDYGVDSRRPIPVFRYIRRDRSTQTIEIRVEEGVAWDVDWVTLEPIILRREFRPEAAMIIGAIISALIGAVVSFYV